MRHFFIFFVVFACASGSVVVGLYLRKVLPAHHLNEESAGVVRLATGLIATMAALVLGLLISSAKGSFDTVSTELIDTAAHVVRLDRVLAKYGPETKPVRDALRQAYASTVATLASDDPSRLARMDDPESVRRAEDFQRLVEGLSPQDAIQRDLKARALLLVDEVFATRWLAILKEKVPIPVPLLVALVLWLVAIFGTFGLYAPHNGTTIAVLLVCALSASGAIFLILELNSPLDGVVRVSLVPLREALAVLGK
ncbi:hypothetical protein AWB67_06356 [Caballeronia terrestris]|uniref:DUF4239 domain-containing protein n=1 Tax=Caballeronia terrestris TaxID=1226301 RepID=A0A158KQ37_9BURK|nr:DUF4239 domain-containing protein [Caballeronia terrestris]SAL83258.1 hypothetical protein AWB67_06356 [Caballeronia terrestris]